MRLSTLFGRTLREAPAEADHVAHQLVLRAGLARPLLAGGFALLPLGMGALRRIEAIMHEELARIDAQEFRTPVVQSSQAWEQTGRYADYGPLMLRLSDRSDRSLIVAPTHEEAVAELARREVASYRQLPQIVYQIHTKYRDELRTRGGLMRMREFTMLDAYSLDADAAGLDASYDRLARAFERIFDRCGVRYVAVEASAGEMGGGEPREYMALADFGEDTLAICPGCGYAANLEVAVAGTDGRRPATDDRDVRIAGDEGPVVGGSPSVGAGSMEEVATPDCKTIADVAAFLGVPESGTAKAVFFDTPERGLLFVVIRGDVEVNEAKLRAAARVSQLLPASAEQIVAAGAVPGYASPVGLTVETMDDGPQATAGERRPASDSSPIVHRPSSGVFVVADRSVVEAAGGHAGPPRLVAGANREGYHMRDVIYGRDWRATLVADIATVRAGDPCARCGAQLALQTGVEIGHIFKLGTRFSEAIGATYLDQEGVARPVVMGSYGIGLERLIQVIVDQHHDGAGIVWPAAVAPLDVHLVLLGSRNADERVREAVRRAAEALYEELRTDGLRVLYDDRDESAGVKFNDADLIGLPLRLVIGERLLGAGEVELRPRGGEARRVPRGEALAAARAALA